MVKNKVWEKIKYTASDIMLAEDRIQKKKPLKKDVELMDELRALMLDFSTQREIMDIHLQSLENTLNRVQEILDI